MNNTQLQLVSFEQAKKLKELGFYWELHKCYDDDGKLLKGSHIKENHNDWDEYFSAPPIALALKWFRDVRGIPSYVKCYRHIDNMDLIYYKCIYRPMGSPNDTEIYTCYEAAESALLDRLIELAEENNTADV